MSTTTEQPTDLTQRIQARDGVAVVIYTKNDCRWCDMTKKILDREQYVTETLNRREMPVVIAGPLGRVRPVRDVLADVLLHLQGRPRHLPLKRSV